jgi:hypothetical protein
MNDYIIMHWNLLLPLLLYILVYQIQDLLIIILSYILLFPIHQNHYQLILLFVKMANDHIVYR